MRRAIWILLLSVGCGGYQAGVDDLEPPAEGKEDSVGSYHPAPQALPLMHALRLDQNLGKPFLKLMLAEGTGVKATFDADYVTSYTFADWNTVHDAIPNFDYKIVRRVLGAFPNRAAGLKALVDSLQGKSFQPSTLVDTLFATPGHGRDVYTVAEVLAMASGAGTAIDLNGKNYYYNYGYKSGTDIEEDVKSGRSFGASPGHPANDASDTYYLGELGRYLTGNADVQPFYQTLLEVLTQSQASGLDGLDSLGQAVATDFTAIYTAESDRHIIAQLGLHAWENDLAEVTFLASFGTAVGKVMQNGRLVDGTPTLYWAKSPTSNRSGIGETRQDRRALQRLITDYERAHHPELLGAIQEAVHASGSDIFRTVMYALNDRDFLTNPAGLDAMDGQAITRAVTAFLVQVRADAPAMLDTPAFQAVSGPAPIPSPSPDAQMQ